MIQTCKSIETKNKMDYCDISLYPGQYYFLVLYMKYWSVHNSTQIIKTIIYSLIHTTLIHNYYTRNTGIRMVAYIPHLNLYIYIWWHCIIVGNLLATRWPPTNWLAPAPTAHSIELTCFAHKPAIMWPWFASATSIYGSLAWSHLISYQYSMLVWKTQATDYACSCIACASLSNDES